MMTQKQDKAQKSGNFMSRDDEIVFWIMIFVVLFSTLN